MAATTTMTAEIPERPRRDGPPTGRQIKTALYVIEYLRNERVDDRTEVDVLNDAHLLVDAYGYRDDADGESTDDRD